MQTNNYYVTVIIFRIYRMQKASSRMSMLACCFAAPGMIYILLADLGKDLKITKTEFPTYMLSRSVFFFSLSNRILWKRGDHALFSLKFLQLLSEMKKKKKEQDRYVYSKNVKFPRDLLQTRGNIAIQKLRILLRNHVRRAVCARLPYVCFLV